MAKGQIPSHEIETKDCPTFLVHRFTHCNMTGVVVEGEGLVGRTADDLDLGLEVVEHIGVILVLS